MIFERSLQRELGLTAGAVFLVLLTVMLTTMMIRVVGLAASGGADPSDVLVLIGLTVVGYLAVMLIVTLFVSVLFVLTRWYRDSEMAVWFASGVGLPAFIKPVLVFAAPFIVLIAFCAMVAWPWSNAQRQAISQRFAQRDEVSLLASGQFREAPSSHRVFFVERVGEGSRRLENVFVASTENGKLNIVVSRSGHVELRGDADRYAVLDQGRQYDGEPGKPNFRISTFERYGVKMESRPVTTSIGPHGLSTPALLADPNPGNLGELAWRIGLPIMALVLTLLGIPLAYQNPRRGRTLNLVMAVLVYLTYANVLNLMQARIESGTLSFPVGLLLLHVIAGAGAALLFWRRVRNRPLFSVRRARASSGQ
ncbi:LPS export ABC transporter permease LptF [Chitinasiproducens palmae]|uniref:Lipopolysaccharide export system permease protein LptF n=1 Tax=Chitinasiproducens palmae TaxID=1770053 RepID=A0A1H2PN64_9BURK|nr:LPS export ABC transporter permease LptF [Chitinasiproducens palmae]SDV48016.1 lipopolysaccharide export system permease protein [Chitinasiproducens palmae]